MNTTYGTEDADGNVRELGLGDMATVLAYLAGGVSGGGLQQIGTKLVDETTRAAQRAIRRWRPDKAQYQIYMMSDGSKTVILLVPHGHVEAVIAPVTIKSLPDGSVLLWDADSRTWNLIELPKRQH